MQSLSQTLKLRTEPGGLASISHGFSLENGHQTREHGQSSPVTTTVRANSGNATVGDRSIACLPGSEVIGYQYYP
jgi:hypothetical protein